MAQRHCWPIEFEQNRRKIIRRYAKTRSFLNESCGFFCGWNLNYARCVCTIFMADEISADTSVMLLGTMRVVVASAATLE